LNRETLLTNYERLTKLVEKLPGGLQKPILKELVPIRELFLAQRPARLMLLGGTGKSAPEFLHGLCDCLVETGASDNGWRTYAVPTKGAIQILDARFDVPQEVVAAALARQMPDAVLFLREQDELDIAATVELAATRIALTKAEVPLVGIAFGGDSARSRLSALLSAQKDFSIRRSAVCSPEAGDSVAEAICKVLPNEAKLEFARMTGAKGAQAEIAGSLLKSFTAVCGVIGLQPIPLADMPVLTVLQSLMVGLVVYTTGRPVNVRLVGEFLGALGLNIGAGIIFRESARAIIKIIPFWGNAVSGFVAGAGTYAVGRAAIAYFIEETPINETRKLFHVLLPGADSFKRRRLPSLTLGKKKMTPPPLPKDQ